MAKSDLTKQEQKNVRTALRYLRLRAGRWESIATALGHTRQTLARLVSGQGEITASLAFRVARLAQASIDEMLEGRFPAPNTCPHCGHPIDWPEIDSPDEETGIVGFASEDTNPGITLAPVAARAA